MSNPSTSKSPEVSVVIPTRDRWHLLSRFALPAALTQEAVEFEVLVVDDGSTDETSAMLAAFDDSRLRVIRHDRSRGLSAARNAGIREGRGEWIAFLDDDDVWAPRKLRIQLDRAAAEDASFVFGASVVVDARGSVTAVHRPPDPEGLASLLRRRYSIPAGCSNVVVNAATLRRVGAFDERLWHLQDWDLWIRLAPVARAAAVDEILVGYVLHGENSFLADDEHDVVDDLECLLAKHGRGADGLQVDKAGFARWAASRLRRAGKRRHAARTYARVALAQRAPKDVANAAYSLIYSPATEGLRSALARRPEAAEPTAPLPRPAWLDRYQFGVGRDGR